MTVKNFNVPALQLNGEEIVENGKPILLKDVIADMLCGNYQDEAQTLSGLDKYKRAKLAAEIYDGNNNFEIEELAMIKEIVGKRGLIFVVYQIFNIIDGE